MLALSYGTLFLLINSSPSALAAGTTGLLFGAGLHIVGHGWVYTTMTHHVAIGEMAALFTSAILLIGLALFTALPCTVYCFILRDCQHTPPIIWARTSLFASLMTIGEIARSMVFERFSSLSLGYGLIDTWLTGMAPVIGSYGLGWFGFWMVAHGAEALTCLRCFKWNPLNLLRYGLTTTVVVLVAWALQQHRWTIPGTSPLSFRLIQPNTTQGDKFAPELKTKITNQVVNLLTAKPADLIVAPETAFPMYWHELPSGALSALQDFANRTASHLIFGIATTDSQSGGHNSMTHLESGSSTVTQYNKIHLFPFGEYSPVGFSWITDSLAIPMNDLTPGTVAQTPFTVAKNHRAFQIGTLICHENMLSDEARALAARVDLLINPSNMAWVDGTLAMAQNLQITRMRALEVGRPILRVANTGDTALILASGELAQRVPPGETTSMYGQVFGETGLTPYTSLGDWSVWFLCFLSISASWWLRSSRIKSLDRITALRPRQWS